MKWFIGLLLLWSVPAFAGDWYAISNHTGECIDQPGPVQIIGFAKELRFAYTTDDVTENGRVVETTIAIPSQGTQFHYFRTKERCERFRALRDDVSRYR